MNPESRVRPHKCVELMFLLLVGGDDYDGRDEPGTTQTNWASGTLAGNRSGAGISKTPHPLTAVGPVTNQ